MSAQRIDIRLKRGRVVEAIAYFTGGKVMAATHIEAKGISDEDGNWDAAEIEFGGTRHEPPTLKIDVFLKLRSRT